MKFKSKNVYMIMTILYIIFTIIELVKYFIFDASIFGLLYLIINMIIIFLISMVSINYDKAVPIKRISKVLIACILGVFSSFILNSIVLSSLSYTLINDFVSKIYLTKNIFKPIIYVLFIVMSALEIKVLNSKKEAYNTQKSIKKRKKFKNI